MMNVFDLKNLVALSIELKFHADFTLSNACVLYCTRFSSFFKCEPINLTVIFEIAFRVFLLVVFTGLLIYTLIDGDVLVILHYHI